MKKQALIGISLIFTFSCKDYKNKTNMDTITIPKAKKIEHIHSIHDDKRSDFYFWMKKRDDKMVLDYLNQENEYVDHILGETQELQNTIFEEIKSKIKKDDSSIPYLLNGYYYQSKYEKDGSYAINLRWKKGADKKEVLFDQNEMAKDKPYFALGGIGISDNNKLAVFSTDIVGRRKYTIQIKDLETGELLKDKIENSTGGATWAADNQSFFYTKKDSVTLRSHQIYRHILGTNSNEDILVYQEDDERFSTYIYRSKSRKYIFIGSSSSTTSEYRFIEANQPTATFKLVQKRVDGLEYEVSNYKDNFYILTNKDDAFNFKLMKTKVTAPSMKHWVDEIAHREDVLLEDFDLFSHRIVLNERKNGLNLLRIKTWDNSEDYYIPFNEETYATGTTTNLDFDAETLRYSYNSMTTPPSALEYNFKTKKSKTLKQQEVLDENFNPENYESKRIWATAKDGVKIPISLVYKKGIELNRENPTLIYGYGSYGYTIDPTFSISRLSLLDRGFVFAIAHIRGSEYLGRKWYDNGKMKNKMNTFTDFIVGSEYLIEQKYTSAQHLYAMGGSAGGLLMGAISNLKPEIYNGIVSAVPFVDVVTTMLDDSIPLTTGEYEEWGNPNEKEYYDYMKSYSPYDNIEPKAYPNILITTGYHDSQVQYWEPAKYVAKLRDLKTDSNVLLFKTNMEAGHSGASGRFEAIKETALEYAFLLWLEKKQK